MFSTNAVFIKVILYTVMTPLHTLFADWSASPIHQSAKPLTIFMHIPKTAGATISRHLMAAQPEGTVLRQDWFDEVVKYSKITGLENINILCSHLAAKELLYFQTERPVRIFTFLRDPIGRTLSNFFFWRNTQSAATIETPSGEHQSLVDMNLPWEEDLARLLDNRPGFWKYRELSDLMTWQLGYAMYERDGISPRTVFARAKNLLENCFFVGFQNQLLDDLAALFKLMNWPTDTIDRMTRINPSMPDSAAFPDIDTALLDKIKQANRLDIELYEWAVQRFRRA